MPIPPALVEADSVNQRIALIGVQSNVGSIAYNGALYLAAIENDIDPNINRLMMFKSTNGGNTWVAVDRANAPLAAIAYAHYPHYPQVPGSTVYCAYAVPGSGRDKLVQFNLATESWGTPSADADAQSSFTLRLVVLSDGTQVLVRVVRAAPFPPGHFQIDLITFSAGVFAAPVVVDNFADAVSDPAVALDTSDRVFISYAGGLPFNTLVAVFDSGTVGAPVVVAAGTLIRTSPGIYIPSIDAIWFGAASDPASGNTVGVLKGTPAAAPVWTWENPGGVDPDLYVPFLALLAIKDDNDIFLVWNAIIDDPMNELQIQYLEQINLGGWGPVQVLWDTITQPLTPPSPFPHDEELQIQVGFNSDGLNMTVALFQDFPILGGWCGTIYYLSNGSTPPPPTIRKWLPQYIKRVNAA